MSDDFYRALEDRFRGSRELIKSRLQVYLPFIQPLLKYYPSANAIDLGCGRGEWLEVLCENGFQAQGVDLDDAMLVACRERGLNVYTGDAIAFLRTQPDNSQALVSGFHIAEHLPFEVLQVLVKEALRILVPGGLLILETPNPENLVTGTSAFYLDPTHQRPIPPQLLDFLTEYAGFIRSKIVRLQESQDLVNKANISLLNVLNGVSPDYSVIAQKEGPEVLLTAFRPVFLADYGLTLEALANSYQKQSEAKAQQVEAKAQQVMMELQAVYSSTSWRITAPLRSIATQAKELAPKRLKPRIRLFLKHAALFVSRRPWLRRAALALLNHVPSLKKRLANLINGTTFQSTTQRNVPTELAHLTPRARQIYADLKKAIDNNKRPH